METKTCSKCKVVKELEQFDKYFHSTQNKERIRGYCKSCFRQQQRIVKQNIKNKKITQPVEDMTQPEVLPIEYDTSIYKFCIGCNEWKVIDTDFYRYSKKACNKRCKKCENKIRSDMYYEELDAKGGHDMAPQRPGIYADHYQQEQTEGFLTLLGWTKSDEGVWWKEGFKTAGGIWLKNNGRKRMRAFDVPRSDKGVTRGLRVPKEIQDGIVEMYKNNHKQIEIVKTLHVCKQTIRKVINNYQNQSR
jgi:hypothetical protein